MQQDEGWTADAHQIVNADAVRGDQRGCTRRFLGRGEAGKRKDAEPQQGVQA